MVLVLDGDREHAESVRALVRSQGHQVRILASWSALDLAAGKAEVLLVDLDTVETDDRRLGELARRGSGPVVMTMSASPHHPHLGQSMQKHVFAALAKPLDPEELNFWLRSIPGP